MQQQAQSSQPSTQDKKYYQYSLAFYGKESSLKFPVQIENNIQKYFQVSDENIKTLFIKFNKENIQQQRIMLEKDPLSLIEVFNLFMAQFNHDKFVMKTIITTIDGILLDDKRNLRHFKNYVEERKDKNIIEVIQKLIVSDQENVTKEAAFRVLSVLIGDLPQINHSQQYEFLNQLVHYHSLSKISDFIASSALVNLIKHEHIAKVFLQNGGIQFVQKLFEDDKSTSQLQPMYYLILNIWLLSYNKESFKYFEDPQLGLIRKMTEVLQKIFREKIIRVTFATFRNLVDGSLSAVELMIDAGVLKIIDSLLKGNIKDQEILDDLEYVGRVLEKNIQVLSSYEKFVKELKTGRLVQGPVHSEKFWKENVKKFEENNYENIKKLVALLESKDEVSVTLACYNLGEFCRNYHFGRKILESKDNKGKEKITTIAKTSKNKLIQESALLALQKIMIQNWQAI